MIILGVVPSSKNVLMSIVQGDRENPVVVGLDRNMRTQKTCIDGKSETQVLYELFEFVRALVETKEIEKIVILQAGGIQYGKKSSVRVKTEAVFQLAAHSKSVPVLFTNPISLKKQSSDFEKLLSSPENVFNEGKAFSPKGLQDALIVAWSGFTE